MRVEGLWSRVETWPTLVELSLSRPLSRARARSLSLAHTLSSTHNLSHTRSPSHSRSHTLNLAHVGRAEPPVEVFARDKEPGLGFGVESLGFRV